jgi:hypothetical protein
MRFKEVTPIEKEAQCICGITKGRVWSLNFYFGLACLLAVASVVAGALYAHGDLNDFWSKWAEHSFWLWLLIAWSLHHAAFQARAKWKRSVALAEMLGPNNWEKVRVRTCCPCKAGCSKPGCFRTDFILSLDREPSANLFLDGHPILHMSTLRLSQKEVERLKSSRL